VNAQSKEEISEPKEEFNIGDSLLKQLQFKQSLEHLNIAAKGFKKQGLWEEYLNSKNKIAENHWRSGDNEMATTVARTVIIESKKRIDSTNRFYAKALNHIGIAFFRSGSLDSAFIYNSQAYDMQKSIGLKDSGDASYSLTLLGLITREQGFYDQSLNYLLQTLEIRKKLHGEENIDIAHSYNNIGLLYTSLGAFERAEEYQLKSLKVKRKVLKEDHPIIGDSYNNLAVIFSYQGAHEKALEYYKRSLEIRKKGLGEGHPDLSITYYNIGNSCLYLGEFEDAYQFYSKGIALFEKSPHRIKGECYQGIADVFLEQEEYDSALINYNIALNIKKATYGHNTGPVSGTNFALGMAFSKMERYGEAIKYFKQAISIGQEVFGENNFEVGRYLNALGDAYFEDGNLTAALKTFQKALIANAYQFSDSLGLSNPIIKFGSQNQTYLLKSLHSKSKSLKALFAKDYKKYALDLSLKTLQTADTLIDQMRSQYLNYEDKIQLSNQVKQSFELAIDVSLQLFKETGNETHLNQAFYFSEKSKASVLNEAIRSRSTKLSLIPNDLSLLERDLKQEVSYYRSQSLEYCFKEKDSIKCNYYEQRYFQTKLTLDSLIEKIHSNHPKYFDIKFRNRKISARMIKENLDRHSAILEFFQGEKQLYCFVITSDTFLVKKIGYKLIVDNLYEYGNKIRNRDSDFQSLSHNLYSLLIEPFNKAIQNTTINHLTIIPDGYLNFLPFETLLTDGKNPHYLIEDYSIRYSYSLLLENNFSFSPIPKSKYIGFAPSFKKSVYNTQQSNNPSLIKEEIPALLWNEEEVEMVAKKIGGTIRTGNDATENDFKSEASKYNILHLATHAFINSEDPTLSRLLFQSNGIDSTDDGSLYVYEIFNLDISPKLVVLSACNTGFGRLSNGEGVLSLAHAFTYSGSPSTIMSHWQVDDQSTSELITLFFKHLANGESKSHSLRKAKLDYLEKASPNKKHPFFWSAFVLVGDDQPTTTKNSFNIIALIGLAAIIGIIFLLRNYLKRSSERSS
jgi:CHAT domain-containing protein